MKKLVILGAVAVVAVGAAFAASINVPFFLDNGGTGFPPASGVAAFIGLHNNTGSPIVCEVTYISDLGVDLTPDANTFTLGANASVSWRPAANDPGVEGGGAAVPNLKVVNDGGGNPIVAGSATISWAGTGTNDIQGRIANYSASGFANSDSYLLPAGF